MRSINSFKQELKKQYFKMWVKNDPAHQQEHFEEVFKTGVYINKQLKLGYSEYATLASAYFIDIFAWDRELHHVRSSVFVRENNDAIFIELLNTIKEDMRGAKGWNTSEEVRTRIAESCSEHRASYTGRFSTPFSEFVSAADREWPETVEKIFLRAYVFAKARNPHLVKADWVKLSFEHVHEKFSRNGYQRLPEMYMRTFKKEMDKRYKDIDNFTLEQATALVAKEK